MKKAISTISTEKPDYQKIMVMIFDGNDDDGDYQQIIDNCTERFFDYRNCFQLSRVFVLVQAMHCNGVTPT